MPNPNPRLENLTSYKPKWKSGKTRTIRVPVAIADRVLELAHKIDNNSFSDTSDTDCDNLPFNQSQSDLKDNRNFITDTGDKIDKSLAMKIIIEALAVPSNKGGKVKTYLAKLGNLLGFQVKRNSKKQWIVTDTSD